jgi:two-component system LytT family response regulator
MSVPLRVVVVDDEPLARTGTAELARRDPGLEVVAECGDGRGAVEAIERLRPDIVLLDIQMPELDGFEVLRALEPAHLPVIVFVTAYDQFAVRAFDVHALDYLVKPFDDVRFEEAMARAKHAVGTQRAGELGDRITAMLDRRAEAPGATGWLTRMVVRTGGRVLLVRVDEIDWIESADYCVKLHVQGKTHVIRESLQALEARLDPARFFRLHRGTIVNLDRIRELQPFFKGEHAVLLQDGTTLKLSRSRRGELEARLGQSL